jgi:hypothetical protein
VVLPGVRPTEREYTAKSDFMHSYWLDPLIVGGSPISMSRFGHWR